MTKIHSLSRQITLSMVAVTMIVVLIVFFGAYLAFAIILTFAPDMMSDSLLPTGTDVVVLFVLGFLALLVAGAVSFRLASRILIPLNSLAETARKIADGDLTARAVPGDQSLGETAHLVDDFNAMAQRLELMAEDVLYWNAAIAHELRTPLTVLKGRLQGVADGMFKPDSALIEGLILQVDGLSRLVDDLRTVTLADSGNLDLQLSQVNLAHEVESVAGIVGPSLEEDGFELNLSTVPLIVNADAVRVRQVLLALLNNAKRYANPGIIDVSILKDGLFGVLQVADSGPGLPPDFVRRAFDPFSRAEESRSRRHGGSGLGLSIVRAIAEAHHGKATCRNSSSGGAVFEVRLPLRSTIGTRH